VDIAFLWNGARLHMTQRWVNHTHYVNCIPFLVSLKRMSYQHTGHWDPVTSSALVHDRFRGLGRRFINKLPNIGQSTIKQVIKDRCEQGHGPMIPNS
jgi:hypothetical protein